MPLTLGTTLGPYEVLAPLGAGGMGEVYRAHDARLGRDVAVKVVPPGLAADTDRLQRFEQEARAAGTLSHPNLLTAFDIGLHDGGPYNSPSSCCAARRCASCWTRGRLRGNGIGPGSIDRGWPIFRTTGRRSSSPCG